MTVAASLSGIVSTGPMAIAVLVALLVGVLGFASPCVLPLVPGYLSYVTGLSGSATAPVGPDGTGPDAAGSRTAVDRRQLRRTVAGAVLFVSGFSVVFIASGALFGQLGSTIQRHLDLLERVFGAVTIVLGLVFLGAFSALQREFKVHRLPRAGIAGAPLLGATFGLVWTPCLTPTYAAVAALAFSQATAVRGAILLTAYCIGLGVPFVLVALGIGWAGGAVAFLRRHAVAVSRTGGILLVTLGVLMMTGLWTQWIRAVQTAFATSGVQI